jgi:hypothetical protein
MKMWPVTVMALSLVFGGSGAFSGLNAQDAAVTPAAETQRCVNWIKATVPVASMPNPADFCSGIQDGNLGAWIATFTCGAAPALLTGTAPTYCASWGEIRGHQAWAAEYTSTTKDGRELLDADSEPVKDSPPNAVTFYSTAAVRMGSLRIPAGMYKLIPSKSPDGWSLAVAKLDGEWNDAKAPQQSVGTIEMKSSASDIEVGKDYLELWAGNFAGGCEGRSSDFNNRELHFISQSTDLAVCIRPEQVPQSQEANMTGDFHGAE